jgi:hypothetical protein
MHRQRLTTMKINGWIQNLFSHFLVPDICYLSGRVRAFGKSEADRHTPSSSEAKTGGNGAAEGTSSGAASATEDRWTEEIKVIAYFHAVVSSH